MSNPVFLFGTPEGGSADVKTFLEESGYTVVGIPEVHLSSLWDFVAVGDKTKSGLIGPAANGLLARMHFAEETIPEKIAYLDNYVGMNFGYGFKMWTFLVNNIPNAKIIFAYMGLDSNLARVLAMNKKWIPNYGSCPSNCEFKIKNQISQFEEFASFFPKNSLIFNAKYQPFIDITEFIK